MMVEAAMRALLTIAGLLLSPNGTPAGAVTPSAMPPSVPGKPLAAVWKEQHLGFVYAGRTSRYSCDNLREKMLALLLEMGVRRDLKISAVRCGSRDPGLQLEFSSPALPATRLEPPDAAGLTVVQARFEKFILTSDAFRNFSSADCELVEEFTRQILPKLATRDIAQDISCVPYEENGSRYVVRGEVLRTLPRNDQGTGYRDAAPAP
jgi:hypothetical protein